MKYKDLPSAELVQKLLSTSFESPSSNREVFDWCESVSKHIKFLEGERVKLVQKYGDQDEYGNCKVPNTRLKDFIAEFNEVLNMDLNGSVSDCPVHQSWFDEDKCRYPKDKGLWITPAEIGLFRK